MYVYGPVWNCSERPHHEVVFNVALRIASGDTIAGNFRYLESYSGGNWQLASADLVDLRLSRVRRSFVGC
jgi:hypothetical protein